LNQKEERKTPFGYSPGLGLKKKEKFLDTGRMKIRLKKEEVLTLRIGRAMAGAKDNFILIRERSVLLY